MMLSQRRANVLKVLINEYITTAMPVGSEVIVRKYPLGVSPATVRNEMAYLEGEGYITHPYTSAGRIPADKGYRYYVEAAPAEPLPAADQEAIRQQLAYAAQGLEELAHWAALVLARAVQNVALVTLPQVPVPRVRHVELVPLHDLVVLLLVLYEAQVRRQALALDYPVRPEQLTALANRINALLQGLSAEEIRARLGAFAPPEAAAVNAILAMLEAEQAHRWDEAHWEGLRNLLAQPEFSDSARALTLLDMLEDRQARRDFFASLDTGALRVAIGSEHRAQGMEDYSVVLMRYGVPGQVTGNLAVLGPTRMAYPRVIASIRYVSAFMTDLIAEQHLL